MLKNWSIRTTLTLVGLLFVGFAAVVSALSLNGLRSAGNSLALLADSDMVSMRALNDASSNLLRSRVALDRVRSLTEADKADEAKKALDRGQFLLDKSNESWKLFVATPKPMLPQATLDDIVTKHDALLRDGVEPEFAAIRAGDMAAYHAIADTKISPMFIAFDAVTAVTVGLTQKHAEQLRTDAAASIALLINVIVGVMALVAGLARGFSGFGAALIFILPILLRFVPAELGVPLHSSTAEHLSFIIIGALIIFFLIVEPHGLARLWQIAKQKLRVWPYPY